MFVLLWLWIPPAISHSLPALVSSSVLLLVMPLNDFLIAIFVVCDWYFGRHPDKNNSPEAHDKFLQITEAYEVLSHEDRRWKYDNGHLEQDQDPFANFNKKFYFHFPNVHRSDNINIQYYKDHVIPDSYNKPYLLYFYHDFCPSCVNVWRVWDQLKSVRVCVVCM